MVVRFDVYGLQTENQSIYRFLLFQNHLLSSLFRIQFGSSGSCEEWTKRLLDEMSPPVKIEDIFAFAHLAWSLEGGVEEGEGAGEETSWFRAELARLRFDLQGRI